MSVSINYVSSIGHVGPKSTSVFFGPLTADNARPWAWVSNTVAGDLCPGMIVVGDIKVSTGKLEVEYVGKDGVVVPLRTPRQHVFLSGNFVFDAPVDEAFEPAVMSVSDSAREFKSRVANKQAQTGDDTPI